MAIIEHPSADPARAPQGLAARLALWADGARRRRLTSLGIAVALELLILLLLLTLGTQIAGVEDGDEDLSTFEAVEFAAPPEPAPEQAAETSPAETPQETQPVTEQPVPQPLDPSPLILNPQAAPEPARPAPPRQQPQPQPTPQPQTPARPKIGARIRPGPAIGPADTGNPRTAGDSERVGTARNGEPLYAARWYREPTDQELAGYLSTARGPGSALIECRTVPDYYVEDCTLLAENPPGSLIGRAVLAAAWQFRVRPARIGGREQVGTWVRIRIDYTVRRQRR